jgi:hypothetical protein
MALEDRLRDDVRELQHDITGDPFTRLAGRR